MVSGGTSPLLGRILGNICRKFSQERQKGLPENGFLHYNRGNDAGRQAVLCGAALLRKEGSAVEKRRIRLEINGVVCGLITEESEEYMESLAEEVGELMRNIQEASPYITREAAALTAALGYCDDMKKNGSKVSSLQERIDELEVEAELWQEEKDEMAKSGTIARPDRALQEKIQRLERENTALAEDAGRVKELEEQAARLADENAALREQAEQFAVAKLEASAKRGKNPMRYEEEFEQEGFVSFFEKK